MSFCADCVKGVRHEGTPEGKWETIGGVNAYVATPTGDYPKDKVVLYLPDVFGPQLVNNRLLADDYARNGFRTVIPDIVNGDPIPPDALNPGSSYSIAEWFKTHGTEQTRPPLDKVIAALKEEGVTAFGAAGYCFGGRYAFDLAHDNVVVATVASHPSLLKVPEDLEKYVAQSRAPLLINSCSTDAQFPLESSAQADKIFAGFTPGYKREFFDGCTHGFAVRGDLSNPVVKAAKEAAFVAAIEWFKKYL